jgi:dihydrofolate synthase/folylpolyglutamate synthase
LTYEELEARLSALSRGGMKLGLDRMERALAELGSPHLAAPVVHVAGSNGKGSVCAFLAASCRAAGLRTGLYTSPHLERFAERYVVDGQPVSAEALVRSYEALEARVPWAFAGPDALTFFELVTLLGFQLFGEAKLDVLVAEVGLGGRLDATNVVRPLVSCLTPIGYEHQDYLGDTLTLIAREKGGILKSGAGAASARQDPEARDALDRAAARVGVSIEYEGQDFELRREHGRLVYQSGNGLLDGLRLGLRGAFQESNAAVALRALELAAARGLPVTLDHAAAGLAQAQWPGRLETVRRSPDVVLDGAHNPHAAAALAAAAQELFAGRKLHLVLGMLADKDATPVVQALVPLAWSVVVTAPDSPRARAASELAELAGALHPRVQVIEPVAQALDTAIAGASARDVVLVCGSLYLVGQARAHLRGTRATGPRELLRPVS